MKRKSKILLTGGHAATTALSLIEELKEDSVIDWDISWVGPKKSLSGGYLKPFELSLFPSLGVRVFTINAGKIQSKFTRHTIPEAIKIPIGFAQALLLVLKIQPSVVVAFGGFASLPIVFWSWVLRIPIIVDEQITGAGLANRLSGIFASKIAVAKEASLELFPREKCELIGIPLTRSILETPIKEKLSKPPTIYITGGSRGSQRINELIFNSLPWLLSKFKIIHQTGPLDIKKAQEIKSNLSKEQKERYSVYDFVSPLKVSDIYAQADILIGRAGANTVAEALYLSIPSIFIPIPWSIGDEQTKNANYAQKVGVSKTLKEAHMNADTLKEELETILKNWNRMNVKARKFENIDVNASKKLLTMAYEMLK